jgi:copper chaperone CopZ
VGREQPTGDEIDMRTEVTIDGADCPYCLNETIEHLRSMAGVQSVEASSVSRCLVVEHADLDVDALVAAMHEHLHGVGTSGTEIVMTEVGPTVRLLGCSH